jgi:hypothetical protein
MSTYLHCCAELKKAIEDPDIPVQFISKFREYGVNVLDGGSSYLQISNCPWCGTSFPKSLRNEWFDSLESKGIDPMDVEAIPVTYRDERWYA